MFMAQAYKAYQLGGKVSELLYSPALYGIDLSAQNMPKPRARCSPMLAVVGNTLWLFGGTVEVSSYSPTENTSPWNKTLLTWRSSCALAAFVRTFMMQGTCEQQGTMS